MSGIEALVFLVVYRAENIIPKSNQVFFSWVIKRGNVIEKGIKLCTVGAKWMREKCFLLFP